MFFYVEMYGSENIIKHFEKMFFFDTVVMKYEHQQKRWQHNYIIIINGQKVVEIYMKYLT